MLTHGNAIAGKAMAAPGISVVTLDSGDKRDRGRVQAVRRTPRTKPSLAVLRTAHVLRALNELYPDGEFPDDGLGHYHLFIALQVRAPKGEGEPALRRYVSIAAPWMSDDECGRLLDRVFSRPLKFSADKLGRIIGLKDADRSRLGITTIGAVDVSKSDRQARRKARKAANRKAGRRASGMKPREQWLAGCLTRSRPWEAFSIKRRAWEKRGKPIPPPEGRKSVTQHSSPTEEGDTPAYSIVLGAGAPERAKGPRSARVAHRSVDKSVIGRLKGAAV